ncbi:hypothetical protein V8E53_005700 [Lactarius tabidus]
MHITYGPGGRLSRVPDLATTGGPQHGWSRCRCGAALYFRFAWTFSACVDVQYNIGSCAIMLCAKQVTDRRNAISYCCSGTTRRPGLRFTKVCNYQGCARA